MLKRARFSSTRCLYTRFITMSRVDASAKRKFSPLVDEDAQSKKAKAISDTSHADRESSSLVDDVADAKHQTIPLVDEVAKNGDVITKAANGQPTNKVLPVNIRFLPRVNSANRLVTWNVCSLASSQKKGFQHYVEAENPDILVLTETKVNNIPADPFLTNRFPHRYWSISEKKGYAGTAILSKIKPLSVTRELPGYTDPKLVKGRIITLEFPSCFLIGTYVINAGEKLKTLDAKNEWHMCFDKYIHELDKKKPVIWAGDLNVAPTAMDLANAKRHWNKSAGYTEAETSAFKRILNPPNSNPDDNKLVDIWRELHPELEHYSYFSFRSNCRGKGLGWRLDMFVLSESLIRRVRMCEIRGEIWGASDHCPVVLDIEGEL